MPSIMPVRSLNSFVLKWPDQKTVDHAVRSWSAEQGQHRPELLRFGYFGSYARGNWGVGSDLDLIAVVDDAAEPFGPESFDPELTAEGLVAGQPRGSISRRADYRGWKPLPLAIKVFKPN